MNEVVRGRVVVVGSANVDVVVAVPRFPRPGETVQGAAVTHSAGGKGLNQAVASALTGARTTLVAAIGRDDDGEALRAVLAARGVSDDGIVDSVEPTGSAHIVVDRTGANQIVVVPGANGTLTPEAVDGRRHVVEDCDVLVVQGEVAPAASERAVELAASAGVRVIVNLAPVVALGRSALTLADPLVVNEVEAGAVLSQEPPSSVEAALVTARRLAQVCPSVVVTLGGAGAVVVTRDGRETHIPAPDAPAVVDTTGAGDAFVGVLAARLARGAELLDAARDAVVAASATVGVAGASVSYPGFGDLLAGASSR